MCARFVVRLAAGTASLSQILSVPSNAAPGAGRARLSAASVHVVISPTWPSSSGRGAGATLFDVADLEKLRELKHNRGPIADPEAFARDANAASWLFLCGEEFATMPGGMSYAQVQAAVPDSANVVSDPPRVLTMDLARRQVAALDRLPRPTLVTCRAGPRSSALVYLYAGLQAGATADAVLARAEADDAPFCASEDLKAWVRQGLDELFVGEVSA
jgi:hypothetical protein